MINETIRQICLLNQNKNFQQQIIFIKYYIQFYQICLKDLKLFTQDKELEECSYVQMSNYTDTVDIKNCFLDFNDNPMKNNEILQKYSSIQLENSINHIRVPMIIINNIVMPGKISPQSVSSFICDSQQIAPQACYELDQYFDYEFFSSSKFKYQFSFFKFFFLLILIFFSVFLVLFLMKIFQQQSLQQEVEKEIKNFVQKYEKIENKGDDTDLQDDGNAYQ